MRVADAQPGRPPAGGDHDRMASNLRIKFRPLRRGVKKIGLFFREETASSKRSAFGSFRKNDSIFSLGDAAGEFSLWFVSLFFVKKRNEQSTAGGGVSEFRV
jgi:hypothetical protein